MKDTIKQVNLASRAIQTLVFLYLSLSNVRCVSKHFRIVSKVIDSFQNDFLWKQDKSIILVYLTLICIALEAGEVEVTLSYFSAYFRTFSPYRAVRYYILPTVIV